MSGLEPTCTVRVPMDDGADVAAFVYAPAGVRDEPGTPFAVTWDPAPVVVLHGNGERHGHMADVIESLARERSVIAIDTRGHGESVRGSDPLTYERLAADVLEVMSRLGVTQAHLVGFSDGGIVGLLVARDVPWRVLSLTVIGANLTPEGLLPGARLGMRAGLAALGVAAPLRRGRAAGRYGQAELLRLMLEQPHIEPASLASISCPTCVMAGSRDLVLPEETERIAAAIPGARLVVVPGAGHDLPEEAPERVVREACVTMAAGKRPSRLRPLVTFETGRARVAEPPAGIAVVPAGPAEEAGVLALYERLLDSCKEPGRETCGWRRGHWPLPRDVSERLREGTTWIAVEASDVAGDSAAVGEHVLDRAAASARILGAMSLDGDFGLPNVEPDWEPLGPGEFLTCHLLVCDPSCRGRGVATALLRAYVRQGIRRGCRALRINTSPQSLSNRLYHELGFVLHRPVWFPYEGLPLSGWTNVYELRLDGAGPSR